MPIAVEQNPEFTSGDGNASPDATSVDVFDPESIKEVPDIQDVVKEFKNDVRGIHRCCLLVPDIRLRDFRGLVGSIAQTGLTEAIKVDKEKRLVDGRCRLRACYLTGVEPRFETIKSDKDAWLVSTSNLTRRNLTAGQRAAYADSLRERFDQAAKQRQRKRDGDLQPQGVETFDALSIDWDQPAKARDQVGQIAGVSGKSVDLFRKIKQADPELADKVAQGKVSLHAAQQQLPRSCPKRPKIQCAEKLHPQSLDADCLAQAPSEPSIRRSPAVAEHEAKNEMTTDTENDKSESRILYEDDSVMVLGNRGETKKRVIICGHDDRWWVYPSDTMNARYRFTRTSREKAMVMAEKILEATGRLANPKQKS